MTSISQVKLLSIGALNSSGFKKSGKFLRNACDRVPFKVRLDLIKQKKLLIKDTISPVFVKILWRFSSYDSYGTVQKQPPRGVIKKGILKKKKAKLTEKHQWLFFNKAIEAENSDSCEFWEIFKNSWIYKTPLWWLLLRAATEALLK